MAFACYIKTQMHVTILPWTVHVLAATYTSNHSPHIPLPPAPISSPRRVHAHPQPTMQNGTHTRELYDAAVIGAGYAGVTAAITLARALHTVLVFDDDRPVNRWNTAIHHMPTWEGKRADVTRRECKSDLQAPGVRLVEQTVTHVDSKSDGSFVLTDASGSTYAVRKLLLACGVEHELPALEGYDACFTRGM